MQGAASSTNTACFALIADAFPDPAVRTKKMAVAIAGITVGARAAVAARVVMWYWARMVFVCVFVRIGTAEHRRESYVRRVLSAGVLIGPLYGAWLYEVGGMKLPFLIGAGERRCVWRVLSAETHRKMAGLLVVDGCGRLLVIEPGVNACARTVHVWRARVKSRSRKAFGFAGQWCNESGDVTR